MSLGRPDDTPMPTRLLRLPLAATTAATAACFPAVTHGPRVESGLTAGVTGAYTWGPTHVEGDEGGINLREGVVGPYAGYGWAPARATRPGVYLGVAVPAYFPLAQVDAYVQAPPAWTGPLSAGVGVVASLEGVHGYGQVGRVNDRGVGVYLTGGYGSRESTSRIQGSSPAWFGGAALQLATGHLRTQLFVQGATGHAPDWCREEPGLPRECPRGATEGPARRLGRGHGSTHPVHEWHHVHRLRAGEDSRRPGGARVCEERSTRWNSWTGCVLPCPSRGPSRQSARSASVGATPAARRAGTQLAATTAMPNSTTIPANVAGSDGATS
jgi:hypothetical protein